MVLFFFFNFPKKKIAILFFNKKIIKKVEIQKPEWNHKRASITAFMCLLEGKSPYIENLLRSALPLITNFFNDPNNYVKNSVALFLKKTAESNY